jgi:hypothetical protein
MGRAESDELSAAQIMYPCMQCADIFFLKVCVCGWVGGVGGGGGPLYGVVWCYVLYLPLAQDCPQHYLVTPTPALTCTCLSSLPLPSPPLPPPSLPPSLPPSYTYTMFTHWLPPHPSLPPPPGQADICQLGLDQRKVNMLAREYCDATKRRFKPVILSHRMMPGLLEVGGGGGGTTAGKEG